MTTGTIKTNAGSMKIEFYDNDAPNTVKNFCDLANKGFYEGLTFHRVIPGFVIQGGGFEIGMNQKATKDPIVNESNNGLKNEKYTLSMARTSDLDSATSQFFINLADNEFLDYPNSGGYAVFGKVISGQDVVDEIAKVKTTFVSGHQDVPIEDVYMINVTRK